MMEKKPVFCLRRRRKEIVQWLSRLEAFILRGSLVEREDRTTGRTPETDKRIGERKRASAGKV